MLTLFGYVPPATLFLLGVMGLLSGHIPYLTRRPLAGWQIRAVAVLLMVPLAVSVWLGTRQPRAAGPLGELAADQQLQGERSRNARAIAADRGEAEIVALMEKNLEGLGERAIPAREELQRVTDSLQEYERFFDRLFVSLMALLIAVAVVPATKPFPREPSAQKGS